MPANNKSFAPTAKALVQLYGATVVNLSSGCPTYKFPTAPRDAYDTLLGYLRNLTLSGADAAKGFVVGGASAGSPILPRPAVQKWLSGKSSRPPSRAVAQRAVRPSRAIVPESTG